MKIKSAAGHKLAFYNPAGSHGGAPTSTSVYCSTHHEYYGNLIIYNSTLYTLLQENLLFLDLFAMKTPSSALSVCLKCLTKSLLSAYWCRYKIPHFVLRLPIPNMMGGGKRRGDQGKNIQTWGSPQPQLDLLSPSELDGHWRFNLIL